MLYPYLKIFAISSFVVSKKTTEARAFSKLITFPMSIASMTIVTVNAAVMLWIMMTITSAKSFLVAVTMRRARAISTIDGTV